MRKLRVGLQSVYQPASEKKSVMSPRGGRSQPIMSTYASSTPTNLNEPYHPKPLGEKTQTSSSVLSSIDTTPTTPKLNHTTASRAVNTGRRPPTRKPRAANPVAAAIVAEAKVTGGSDVVGSTPLSPRGAPRTATAPPGSPAPLSGGPPSEALPPSPTAPATAPAPTGFVAAAVPKDKKRAPRVALSSYAAPLKDLVGKRSRDLPSRTTLNTEKEEKDRKAAEERNKTNVINLGQKQVMRVFLEDGTMKTIQVPIPCAASELLDTMAQKLKIVDASAYGIFEFHDKFEIRELKPEDDLKTVIDSGTNVNALFRLVFKKTKLVVSTLEVLIKQFPAPPDYIPVGENEEEAIEDNPSDYRAPPAHHQQPEPVPAEPLPTAPTAVSTPPAQPLPQNPPSSEGSPSMGRRPPFTRPARPERTEVPKSASNEDVSTPPPAAASPTTSPATNRPPVPARSLSAKNVNSTITPSGSPKPGALQNFVSMKNVTTGQLSPRSEAKPSPVQDKAQPPPAATAQPIQPAPTQPLPSPTGGGSSFGGGPKPSPFGGSGGTPPMGRPIPPNAMGGAKPSPGGGSGIKPPPGAVSVHPLGGSGIGAKPPPGAVSVHPLSTSGGRPTPPPATIRGQPPQQQQQPQQGRPQFAKPGPPSAGGRPPIRPAREPTEHRPARPMRPERPPVGMGGMGGGGTGQPMQPPPSQPAPSPSPSPAPASNPMKGPPPARPQRPTTQYGGGGTPFGKPSPKPGPSASSISTPIYDAGPTKEEIVRIFFKDGTFRSLVVQNTTTARNLFDSICSKFKDADLSDHALFHVRASQQRKLEDNEFVMALSHTFANDADKIQFKHRDDVVVLQKKIIRVYFTDNTFKSYQITSEDTVLDIVQKVAKKMNLPATNYALYQMTSAQVSSRLDDTEIAWDVQENWEDGTIFVFANAPPVMKTGFVADPEDQKPQERPTTASNSFRPSYLMHQPASAMNMARLAKENMGAVQLRRVATPIERKHWDSMQVRAFTQWFDWHVAKRDYYIQDLEHDICDGVLLINLLEILSGYDLGTYHDKPQMLISEKLENVTKCFDFMTEVGLPVRGCGPEDILDGNVKLILGMLWPLIYLSAVSPFDPRSVNEPQARKELLSWCQSTLTGFQGVRIENLDSSWQDGLGFCALVSKFAPNLIDYGAAVSQGKDRVAAVMAAVESLGIPPILLSQDLHSQFKPDERSVFAFLLVLRERLTSL